jgi:DNA-binding transcriptional MerR regulator
MYSISDVSRLLAVDPKTLRRWVQRKQIPTPTPGIVNGRLAKCWTERDFVAIKEFRKSGYWGKGINRKTGKKAKKN